MPIYRMPSSACQMTPPISRRCQANTRCATPPTQSTIVAIESDLLGQEENVHSKKAQCLWTTKARSTLGEFSCQRQIDLLSRGASPYDVAKLLGDAVNTIEKHYSEWVKELRERARRI